MSREFIKPFIHVVCHILILSCAVIVEYRFFFAVFFVNESHCDRRSVFTSSSSTAMVQGAHLSSRAKRVRRGKVCLFVQVSFQFESMLFAVNTIVLSGCFNEHYISSLS